MVATGGTGSEPVVEYFASPSSPVARSSAAWARVCIRVRAAMGAPFGVVGVQQA